MLFNSFAFLLFFTSFFLVYWKVFNRSVKLQNLFLLLGSYIFYAYADWRFLFFLIGVSAFNYFLGIYIEKANRFRRMLLYLGLLQGIGGLVFFKYYNFFIDQFKSLFQLLGLNLNLQTLHIIIPVGISFFTFRTISYLLDIDKGKIRATKDWVVFFNYISFFPTVLSGPIDKAILFVPQLERKREFEYNQAAEGMRQILWGLFKKLVIADNCASITNKVFDNFHTLPGSALLVGAVLYTIQIYADFSGYSDMAIGISRLLGFKVTRNFDFPFFSQNIAEFWRRWHISLTSWLTEYLFTPLSIAFRDFGKVGVIMAIIINITIMGLWHGANYTFLLFGFLHGCYFIPLILKGTLNKKKRISRDRLFPTGNEVLNMLGIFTLVMLNFILFRSENLQQAFQYYLQLCSSSLFSLPAIPDWNFLDVITLVFIAIMLITEWFQREKDHGLQIGTLKSSGLRGSIYFVLILATLLFKANEVKFIYSQF